MAYFYTRSYLEQIQFYALINCCFKVDDCVIELHYGLYRVSIIVPIQTVTIFAKDENIATFIYPFCLGNLGEK